MKESPLTWSRRQWVSLKFRLAAVKPSYQQLGVAPIENSSPDKIFEAAKIKGKPIMGRLVLSHFLTVSTASSPRLASSLCAGGFRIRQWKAPTSIPQIRLQSARNASGFRCCCSVSLSQPAAPETSPSSEEDSVWSPTDGFNPPGKLSWRHKKLDFATGSTKLIALENIALHIVYIHYMNTYDTLFFIVDLHAITLPYDAQQLSKATRDTAALYLACGVDTSKASVFVQSHVRAHAEMMWLLSSVTPVGWLNRMIQFKEKSRKAGDENVGVGLLTYPVLMASDILLYQSDFVPVGEDQKQHLELTRELAERVNHLFGGRKWKKLGGRGGSIFKVPEALIPPVGARVMSLTDGLSKMSKSAPSDQSRINLLDPKDVISNKIKRCKTDSFSGMEFDNPERPECNNLLSIYQLVSEKTKEVRYEEIISDSAYLDGILAEGAKTAADVVVLVVLYFSPLRMDRNQLQRQVALKRSFLFEQGIAYHVFETITEKRMSYLDPQQFVQLEELQDDANPNFVEEIVTLFYKDSARLFQKIEQALYSRPIDFAKLDDYMHQFRGSSSRCVRALERVKQEHQTLRIHLENYFQSAEKLAMITTIKKGEEYEENRKQKEPKGSTTSHLLLWKLQKGGLANDDHHDFALCATFIEHLIIKVVVRANKRGYVAAEDKKLELRLGPPGGEDRQSLLSLGCCNNNNNNIPHEAKRACHEEKKEERKWLTNSSSSNPAASASELTNSAAARDSDQKSKSRIVHAPVVGWPPIRSSRKNLANRSSSSSFANPAVDSESPNETSKEGNGKSDGTTYSKHHMFVKINMEGVPIGRKINLKAYDSYEKLSFAIYELFQGLLAAQRVCCGVEKEDKKGETKSKTESLHGSGEYTLLYEDNEGDRMLVGDVPWK
ncbi:unnamed protein product [Malus baccata var. baccata]